MSDDAFRRTSGRCFRKDGFLEHARLQQNFEPALNNLRPCLGVAVALSGCGSSSSTSNPGDQQHHEFPKQARILPVSLTVKTPHTGFNGSLPSAPITKW